VGDKTDSIDGFRLDRGFQVLLTSYPEAGYWITRHYNLKLLPEQLYFMTVVNLKLPIRFRPALLATVLHQLDP
jgi:hypothetical protein